MSRKSQRSRVEMFRKDFITLARECGGSYATKADRVRIAKYFLNYLRENGISCGTPTVSIRGIFRGIF